MMEVMESHATGLRARKKQQARQHISDHATRLFIEQGFDNVTIAQVAAAAQVAKMTVTNYFPRKEDLALDLGDAFVELPAATVRERGRGESALAALRRVFLDAAAEHDPVIGFSGLQFTRMIADSPTLVTRLRQFHDDRETRLAAVLAEETDASPDDVMPKTAAALFGSTLRLLFEETMRRTLDQQSNSEIARAVSHHAVVAFGLLEPTLGDYATHSG